MRRWLLLLGSLVALLPGGATADEASSFQADSHAPIGVMGDHMHEAGEWMLSYRFMRMDMNGSRDDTSRLSSNRVLRDFPVTPTDMDMEMHMLGVMWAPDDRVTLSTMLPFVRLDMKHKTRKGGHFTTRAKGIGDLKLAALIRLFDTETHHLHLNAGLSFPTGSISRKDDTPGGRVRLPYPMQLGSGTYDLLPGITYTGQHERWGWGAQASGTIRTGRNNKGYRWGNRWAATGWSSLRVVDWLSTSLRLEYQDWRGIRGDDDDLMRALVPTADPDLRAGKRLELLLGLNFVVPGGPLAGHRFALEAGRPVYQDLDGPQLETDWIVTAGWQYAF